MDPLAEELFLAYLTGKLSDEDKAKVQAALEKTTKERAAGIALRQVMAAEILERGSPDAHESLARLVERLDGRASERQNARAEARLAQGQRTRELLPPNRNLPGKLFKEQPLSWGRKVQLLPRRIWSGAAVVALALLALSGVWHFASHGSDERPSPTLTYMTGNGERAKITLPDGSVAMLNVASELNIPENFSQHRMVRVKGEALFTVVHHDDTPFTVVAGTTAARVLGTTFVVRRYTTDTATVVAVRDGRVRVGSTILSSGMQLSARPHSRSVVTPVSPSMFTFSMGILTLEDMPLPAAIVELDRWYDADIRLGDVSLASQRMQGQFAPGSIADLARILEHAYNARVVREGRMLTLYQRS